MKILFLSPHTDDVELGAGGTLVKSLELGHEILWVVFSTAEDSLPDNMPKDALKKEFLKVISDLGLKEEDYRIMNFRVRRLHEYRQEILEELVKIRKDFAPDLVIGPSLNDYHQDHQVVAWEMIRAFKNTSSIIAYELPWNHVAFNTQMFVKLEEKHIKKKVELLKNYRSQQILNRPYFSGDFIFGWARMRGIQVRAEFAEAFEVIRWIL
ncbi:MAG: PIG-L family deacetylase [Canidatus Methanoxibalbensis ujae]|nr:PIG-L family deacetylase [Candidatus Methanoxibalbensis ujae]